MAGWWRQFEADLDTMERAIEREHQAAIAEGQPWPPQHTAQSPAARTEAASVIARLQHDGYLRESGPDPEVPSPGPAAPGSGAPAARREAGDRSANPDALQARADQAACHKRPNRKRYRPLGGGEAGASAASFVPMNLSRCWLCTAGR